MGKHKPKTNAIVDNILDLTKIKSLLEYNGFLLHQKFKPSSGVYTTKILYCSFGHIYDEKSPYVDYNFTINTNSTIYPSTHHGLSKNIAYKNWLTKTLNLNKISVNLDDEKEIIEYLDNLSQSLFEYIQQVNTTTIFKRWGQKRINEYFLPYYVADYSEEQVMFSLENNLHPTDYAFAAKEIGLLDTMFNLETFNSLPEEIVETLLSNN